MKNKKIVFGIVLFLLIGLTVFTFANSKENEKVLNPKPSVDDKTNDDDTKKPTQDDDKNNDVEKPSNPTTPSNNNNTTYSDPYDVSARLAYEEALLAVEKAESTKDYTDIDKAYQLVENLTYKQDELLERLDNLVNIVDAMLFLEIMENDIALAENKDDLDSVRDFKENVGVIALINKLTDEAIKEELSNRLNELLVLLDDETSPKVEIDEVVVEEDEKFINSKFIPVITDDNDITATLDGNPYILGDEIASDIATALDDSKYELVIIDKAFNETKIIFTVDKTNPVLTIKDELDQELIDPITNKNVIINVDEKNLDYVLIKKTIITDGQEEIVEIKNENATFDLSEYGDGRYEIQAFDKAGNKSEIIEITIDKTAPVVDIEYSTTETTTKDVIATITSNEEITITNNEGKSEYTFINNGTFTFEFIDKAGNVGSITATVNNIDEENKMVTFSNNGGSKVVKGFETDVTILKENTKDISYVISTVSSEEEIVPVFTSGNGVVTPIVIDDSFTISVNNMSGELYVWIKVVDQNDEVTYHRTANAFITDHIPPTANVDYSTTDFTIGEVIATLVDVSEEITVLNNGGKMEYTFKENGSFTFQIADKAGNTSSVTATVTNIDKEAKKVTFSNNGSATYVNQLATTVSILEENVKEVSYLLTSAVTLDDAKLAFTSETPVVVALADITNQKFDITIDDANGEYYLWVKIVDKAGNESYTRSENQFLLDSIAPTASVMYETLADGSVVATLTNPSEHITVTNNEGKLEHIFTTNGSFEFKFVDDAGNVGSVIATVDSITK